MKDLRKLLYLLQLEEYQTERYFNWLRKNRIADLEERKRKLVVTVRVVLILIFSLPLLPFLGKQGSIGISNKIVGAFFRLFEEVLALLAKTKLYLYPNLVRIVITGSYGKTTFKEKLVFVLSQKYKVLKTPENINTRIGIANVILKKLNRNHQVFVVEAGAYKRGEIRKICELVKPDYGVITIFGVMHLERFGSVRNIREAKSELIPFISDKNKLFVPPLFHQFIDFDKVIEKIGLSLGLDRAEIKKALSSFPGVPRRLEERRENKSLLVLDDSYNSNPLGFRRAVDKLARYKGQKILITPGMIELGKKQYKFNFDAAKYAAGLIDIFVIVGKTNKKALKDGALAAKNKNLKVLFIGKNKSIQEVLMPYFRPPAVVLIENELPDHYF